MTEVHKKIYSTRALDEHSAESWNYYRTMTKRHHQLGLC